MLCLEHVTPPIPVVLKPFTRLVFAMNIAWNPEQFETSCSLACFSMWAL
jgi:hypothetical protein